MEVIRLPVGENAPPESDCISIEERPDGGFSLTGSILAGEESTAIVTPILCQTREAAEEQGIGWAAGCDVPQLYVSTVLLG